MAKARLRERQLRNRLRRKRGGHRSLEDADGLEYLGKRLYYALRRQWRRYRRWRVRARGMEGRGTSR